MDGVAGLARYIASAVKQAQRQGETQQGRIVGGAVKVAGTVMPYVQAVDCELNDGDYVWVVTSNGRAVVVGK